MQERGNGRCRLQRFQGRFRLVQGVEADQGEASLKLQAQTRCRLEWNTGFLFQLGDSPGKFAFQSGLPSNALAWQTSVSGTRRSPNATGTMNRGTPASGRSQPFKATPRPWPD